MIYFINNIARMQQRNFRRKGFFIGSGALKPDVKSSFKPATSDHAYSGANPARKASWH
jgi:hypothetical protein